MLMVHVDDVARMLVALLEGTRPAHSVYNAPCESMVVDDLKREVEKLNSNIRVRLGESYAKGNPRLLDAGRFQREFGFPIPPIAEQLRIAVGDR